MIIKTSILFPIVFYIQFSVHSNSQYTQPARCPNKHRILMTPLRSLLLRFSIVIHNFTSHDKVTSAIVTVNGKKAVLFFWKTVWIVCNIATRWKAKWESYNLFWDGSFLILLQYNLYAIKTKNKQILNSSRRNN